MIDSQPDLFGIRGAHASTSSIESAASPGARATRSVPRRTDRETRRLRQDLERVQHSDELRRLEPVAVIVGCAKREFTMADVRDEAERLGLLTGEEGRPNPGTGRMEHPRALAFLGSLLPGLARIGMVTKLVDGAGRTVFDTSTRERANGNKQALWRITDRGESARAVAGSSLPQLREIIQAYRESGIRYGTTTQGVHGGAS
jgi:hypothetical protein